MELEEYDEEISMILDMFSDECRRHDTEPYTVIVSLPFLFELHVSLPQNGAYPEQAYPNLSIEAGPNQPIITRFERDLTAAMKEEIPLGFPMLAQVISTAQVKATEMEEKQEELDQKEKEAMEQFEMDLEEHERYAEECGIDVWASNPIADRKSKFVAHMSYVQSLDEVLDVVGFLRRQRHIAMATHPTIYAYRFTDPVTGVMQQDSEDDGEAGASKRILFLMEQMKVDGYVVVVTRWYGGILLGPDRFKHIMEVSKEVLSTVPQRNENRKKNQRGNNGNSNGGGEKGKKKTGPK